MSLGKSSRSDYSALTVGAVAGTNWYLADALVKRLSIENLTEALISFFLRYKFERFSIESNAYQEIVVRQLEEAIRPRVGPFMFRRIIHTGDKIQRVQAAEPKIKGLLFREDWRSAYPELMDQLSQFPLGRFDDGPDSLEGLCECINSAYQYDGIRDLMKENIQPQSRGLKDLMHVLTVDGGGADTTSLMKGNW